jgi:hypothetical protein
MAPQFPRRTARSEVLTLPVPPSPTRTSLKVGVSAILESCVDAECANLYFVVFRELIGTGWCVATTRFSVARVVCCSRRLTWMMGKLGEGIQAEKDGGLRRN